MPQRKPPKGAQAYMATHTFVVNVDAKGNVTTDGSGIPKTYTEGRSRIYEGDPVLEHMPEDYFIPLEDHTADMI